MNKIENKIESMNELIENYVLKWMEEHNDTLQNNVNYLLNKRLNEIIARLLGINQDTLGNWNTDNNSKYETPLVTWLRVKAKAELDRLLDNIAGELSSISPQKIESLKKDYVRNIERGIIDRLNNRSNDVSIEIAEQIVRDSITNHPVFSKYADVIEEIK